MATSRRKLLRGGLIGGGAVAAAALAGCGETQIVTETKIQEVIKEVPVDRVVTQIVEKEKVVQVEVEVEKIVTQVVVEEKIVEKIVTVEAMAPKLANVDIVYWSWLAPQLRLGFGPFDEWLRGEFTKRNPHIKVAVQFLPFGELLTKTIASLAGGDAADALHSSVFHARDLYDKGAILDLNDMLKPYPERGMDNYVGIASIFNQFKGKIYGLPGEADADCRTYNVGHLEEAGIDPDPVSLNAGDRDVAVENALKLTQRDGDKITRAGYIANNIRHQQLCGYCYADGLDNIYIDEGKALNPRFRELGPPALQFEYDMLHVHKVSTAISPDRTERSDFFNGMNSSVYMSVADIQEFTKQVGGRFRFEMVHVPRGPNWTDLQGTFWNNMMVVPVKGKSNEAGFEFASWYASA
ncbi:MAG: extracellular solute-binding protein, partial [Pirellulaceae bacterium]|nr:extracellular solute-binding protein [Pirellulaceae bacterium]